MSTNNSFNGIPPVLLQNFDAYEILEPTKINMNPPSTSNEGLLIDFESPIEVNRMTKKEDEDFTILDLYQNIYVTPQHVNNSKNKKQTDIDYEEFLRKLDSFKHTVNDMNSEILQSEKHLEFSHFNLEPLLNHTIHTTNDELHIIEHNNTENAYQEDLIEEVLMDRTIEKLKIIDSKNEELSTKVRVLSTPKILSNNARGDDIFVQNSSTDKQCFVKTEDSKADHCWKRNIPTMEPGDACNKQDQPAFFNTKINQVNLHASTSKCTSGLVHLLENFNGDSIINKFSISNNLLSNKTDLPFQPNVLLKQQDDNKLFSKTDQYESDLINVSSRNDPGKSNNPPLNSSSVTYEFNDLQSKDTKLERLRQLQSNVDNLQSKTFLSDMTTLMNLTINPGEMMEVPVQAVIKDNKEYAKHHTIVSDSKKLNYTKGPSFEEKCVILPLLLRKLSVQKYERDAKNNVKKRMLLYSDTKTLKNDQDRASVKLKPTVLMEDCNKERLKALFTRQRLTSLVQDG